MKSLMFSPFGTPYHSRSLIQIQKRDYEVCCPKEGRIIVEKCWKCEDFLAVINGKYIACDDILKNNPHISDMICSALHKKALKRSRWFTKNGVAGYTFSGGLEIVLYYRPFPENTIILRLRHPKRPPTDVEVELCKAKLFGDYDIRSQSRKENRVYMSIARSSIHGGARIWHRYYRRVNPDGYIAHQRKAGEGRQRQLRRLLGERGYSAYQRKLAKERWNAYELSCPPNG